MNPLNPSTIYTMYINKQRGALYPIFILIPLFVAIYFIQVKTDQLLTKMSMAEYFSILPNGELIKTISLGYNAPIADILWLEAVQAIGEKEQTDLGYEWIYHATDVVTTLDPKFEYSYQIAGIALASLGKKYELSNQILLKGIKNVPDDWRIPFYLGFNYFFYLNDYRNASVYMAKAALLPGHSAYLPGLAARLYVQANDPEVALDFLRRVYQETKDKRVRDQLEVRICEVTVERDILFLNRAIHQYEEKFEKNASNLLNLVSMKIINKIPDEPFGGYYFYDVVKRTAQSSTHPERMKVYRKS